MSKPKAMSAMKAEVLKLLDEFVLEFRTAVVECPDKHFKGLNDKRATVALLMFQAGEQIITKMHETEVSNDRT